jgi:hypothetical protein
MASYRSPIPMYRAPVSRGWTGKPVGVGDDEAVPTQSEGEEGVGPRVDDAEPDPLTGLAAQGFRSCRDTAIDEVVGIGHVAGVTEGRVTPHRHVAHVHPTHGARTVS